MKHSASWRSPRRFTLPMRCTRASHDAHSEIIASKSQSTPASMHCVATTSVGSRPSSRVSTESRIFCRSSGRIRPVTRKRSRSSATPWRRAVRAIADFLNHPKAVRTVFATMSTHGTSMVARSCSTFLSDHRTSFRAFRRGVSALSRRSACSSWKGCRVSAVGTRVALIGTTWRRGAMPRTGSRCSRRVRVSQKDPARWASSRSKSVS